jgi:hypothetical protein
MNADDFWRVVQLLGEQGQDDIRWAQNLTSPEDNFASEVVYVICNSGMKHTVARDIYLRVMRSLRAGTAVFDVFKHPGKVAAIETVWRERTGILIGFLEAPDRLAYCGALPWIGEITKYHLAKNFGVDVAKPDVHLKRLADREGTTAQALCERLAGETGYRIATVDTVLWRACATGVINSRTGEIREATP